MTSVYVLYEARAIEGTVRGISFAWPVYLFRGPETEMNLKLYAFCCLGKDYIDWETYWPEIVA